MVSLCQGLFCSRLVTRQRCYYFSWNVMSSSTGFLFELYQKLKTVTYLMANCHHWSIRSSLIISFLVDVENPRFFVKVLSRISSDSVHQIQRRLIFYVSNQHLRNQQQSLALTIHFETRSKMVSFWCCRNGDSIHATKHWRKYWSRSRLIREEIKA